MLVVMMLSVLGLTAGANIRPREVYESQFIEHINKYNVKISNGQEFVRRLQIFADNMDIIENHNAGNESYKMAINKFSHLTLEEFQSQVSLSGLKKPNFKKSNNLHTAQEGVTLPDSVDWSTTAAVTTVKNQGQCGSCWSFSATGAMEGAYYISTKSGVSLSEQQLVSCDNKGEDQGCNGGWMDDAFAFAQSNGGLCTEDAYPYVSGSGSNPACVTSCTAVSGTAPKSWVDVTAKDVNALQSAVFQQPVAVAIQANQLSFQMYSSGVLTGNCGQNLDHGVLAVGYGVWTDGTPYWKVKNSWGPDWGMGGYILIERSSADKCGILDAASYPVM